MNKDVIQALRSMGNNPEENCRTLEAVIEEFDRLVLDHLLYYQQAEQIRDRNEAEIERLRAALERSERVSAMVSALPVTTEELRRIRNAGKITFDKMVNAITTCLIDMREALRGGDETSGKPKC